MEASPSKVNRDEFPEAVRKAADYLTKQFEEGAMLPARVRFDTDGNTVKEEEGHPLGTFAFFVPDVQGAPHGSRDDDWPWVIYADTARQAYNAQIGEY
jgi:hypothetical protein